MKGPRVFSLFLVSLCMLLCLPVMRGASVTYQFREEQMSGEFVGNIERDMLLQGVISQEHIGTLRYAIMPSTDTRISLFSINDTSSTITTTSRIDREEVCPKEKLCQIALRISVYKKIANNLDLFALWDTIINITDLNDNAPTFPQPFVALSVPESVGLNHTLHTSGAVDKDTAEYSVQGYRLTEPRDTFDVTLVKNYDGTTNLGVYNVKPLDREVRDFYQVRVEAYDGGYPRKSGFVTFNITVTDVNDNEPEFEQVVYNITIKENVNTNLPILKVSATDRDIGHNSELTYTFSPWVPEAIKTRLLIDDVSGEISARWPVDYEVDTRFQFAVEAKDNGSPRLSGSATIIINIEDVNDNAPQININLTPDGTDISEGEAVGKFVAHVSASDKDSGQNGLVICSMNDQFFSLHKFSDHSINMYKVLLKNRLDRETEPTHRVTITCMDSGDPPLSSSTGFTVNVLDVNDVAPVFSKQVYTGSVVENSPGVESLLQVSAVDYDTGPGGQVEFALDDRPEVTDLFSIDSVRGVIQVISPLDREAGSERTFLVWAYDKGSPRQSSSATVIISVQDQNDERPYFVRPLFDCYILEKQPVGTRVGNVSAHDPDSVLNSNMRFSIVKGVGDAEYFAIEPPTGVLKSLAMFDREVKHEYKFQVKVEDPQVPQFYDIANVTVQVLDDNDNPPVIHYPTEGNNTIMVFFGTKVGNLLATVRATDGDDGIFGKLRFLITDGDPSHLFDLNQQTGALLLARTVTPADVKKYTLEIQVQDGGNPPIFENTQLYVIVAVGNGTLAQRSDKMDHNILIVIILVCVTVVLAIAVVVTICLIRRIDRERQQRRAASKAEEEKMFRLKNQDTFMNMSAETSTGSDASSGSNGKNKKKEVSFSIDEGVDSLNTSSGSANTLSTFKSPLDKRMDLHGTENCLSVITTPLRSEPGMLNIPVSHRMSADDNHLQTVQEEEEGCQLMDLLKRNGEDAMSASSGETGTSDSGRGGSEDDSHSNRGSAVDPDGSAMYPQVYGRGLASPSGSESLPVRGRYSNRSSFNSGSGRPPRQHSPHVSFSGNLEYLGESSTDRDDEFPPPPSPYSESPPLQRKLTTFGAPRNNSYRSVLHSHPSAYAGYGGVSTSLVKNSASPTPPPVAECGGGVRQRWGSPSFNDDDDRTTSTTSGSYTINPEDLKREMDELILNDMIV